MKEMWEVNAKLDSGLNPRLPKKKNWPWRTVLKQLVKSEYGPGIRAILCNVNWKKIHNQKIENCVLFSGLTED